MNENERTPAETAADYAVHFADGFFVPCPWVMAKKACTSCSTWAWN